MTRRRFLRRAAGLALGVSAAGGTYGLLEAKWCRVLRVGVGVPALPDPFVGTTVAFLSDVHHGPYVPRSYVRHVVAMTNALAPDLVALGGDYVHKDRKYIAPAIAELGALRAPLGRFAVLGNHDNWEGGPETKDALAGAGITEVTNAGVWVERGGARLRVCGVGDLWTDWADPGAALGSASTQDAVLLLSHNPDLAEMLTDPRVGLMLSGHTHGGQVVLPGYGAPVVPSKYGQKYLHGLVQGLRCRVFVTRGVGTVTPPVRFCCRPEVVLLTLGRLG
jgi:predicted MPP superfamily phosphohydrolase